VIIKVLERKETDVWCIIELSRTVALRVRRTQQSWCHETHLDVSEDRRWSISPKPVNQITSLAIDDSELKIENRELVIRIRPIG